ncbi:uncharacterized protein [Euphorbia lathyris]|uniref:uncharacterized protein n=1 Tax=Euphorbia lathyris TaxID=212925 RepID=UPI00331437B7
MSCPQETNIHQDPFKAWKSLILPHFKSIDIFSLIIKTTLLICVLVSISVLFFAAFANQFRFFASPRCVQFSILHNRKISSSFNNNISGEIHEVTNLSHIVFGIGGSAKTWNERRLYSDLWWRPNSSRGYVWLEETPVRPWPETSPPYKVSEDTSRFMYNCTYGSRSALRIARIIKESFELGLGNVRWFVLGDDDTVFFVENLIMVLRKYDHNQMYYIGANSESVEQDVIHSYNMGYGGGGFAISYPLAKVLVRILDGCIDRYNKFYGSDQRIQACLSEIGIPLTRELGFHQVDIRGNPYGILAAHPVAPLVSLHHIDYVRAMFPAMDRVESLQKLYKPYEKDPGRILQQSICYDLTRNWSISVSWGYTVQLYPSLMRPKVLETAFQTFKTWRSWRNDPYTFNTRPLSPDPCERPVFYFLDGVENIGPGKTLTTYVRHVEQSDRVCERPEYFPAEAVEYFNVTSTTLDPDIWKKAPRRQCCEVINSEKAAVEVKIRGCDPFESVTPP